MTIEIINFDLTDVSLKNVENLLYEKLQKVKSTNCSGIELRLHNATDQLYPNEVVGENEDLEILTVITKVIDDFPKIRKLVLNNFDIRHIERMLFDLPESIEILTLYHTEYAGFEDEELLLHRSLPVISKTLPVAFYQMNIINSSNSKQSKALFNLLNDYLPVIIKSGTSYEGQFDSLSLGNQSGADEKTSASETPKTAGGESGPVTMEDETPAQSAATASSRFTMA